DFLTSLRNDSFNPPGLTRGTGDAASPFARVEAASVRSSIDLTVAAVATGDRDATGRAGCADTPAGEMRPETGGALRDVTCPGDGVAEPARDGADSSPWIRSLSGTSLRRWIHRRIAISRSKRG